MIFWSGKTEIVYSYKMYGNVLFTTSKKKKYSAKSDFLNLNTRNKRLFQLTSIVATKYVIISGVRCLDINLFTTNIFFYLFCMIFTVFKGLNGLIKWKIVTLFTSNICWALYCEFTLNIHNHIQFCALQYVDID